MLCPNCHEKPDMSLAGVPGLPITVQSLKVGQCEPHIFFLHGLTSSKCGLFFCKSITGALRPLNWDHQSSNTSESLHPISRFTWEREVSGNSVPFSISMLLFVQISSDSHLPWNLGSQMAGHLHQREQLAMPGQKQTKAHRGRLSRRRPVSKTPNLRPEIWALASHHIEILRVSICFVFQSSPVFRFAPCSSLAEASALPAWPGIWCSYRTCQHFWTIGPLLISIEIGPWRCFAAMEKRPNPRWKKRISTTCSPKAAVFVSTPWLFIKSPPLGHRLPHCLTEFFGGVVPENPGSAHFQMVFCLLFAALPIHWISAGHLPRQSSDLEHLDRWKHRHIVRDTWVRLKMCHDHFAPCLLNLNVGDASCFIPFVSRSSPIMLGFFLLIPHPNGFSPHHSSPPASIMPSKSLAESVRMSQMVMACLGWPKKDGEI